MRTTLPGSARSVARRLHRVAGVTAVAATLALGGCVAYQDLGDEEMGRLPPIDLHPTPAPTPVPAGVEDLYVMDLREEPGPDPSLVVLTGTIVNRSKEDVVRLQVKVEARDSVGRALSRVVVSAQSEVIPPNTSSSFAASLPRSPAIHDYRAEIVAR